MTNPPLTREELLKKLVDEELISPEELLTLLPITDSKFAIPLPLKVFYTPKELLKKIKQDNPYVSRDFSDGQVLEIIKLVYSYL